MKTIDNLVKSTSAETLSADAGQTGEQPNASAANLPIVPPSFVPQAAQDYTYLRDLDFLPENAKKE